MINDKRMMCSGISGDGRVGGGVEKIKIQALGLGTRECERVWYVTNNIMAVT